MHSILVLWTEFPCNGGETPSTQLIYFKVSQAELEKILSCHRKYINVGERTKEDTENLLWLMEKVHGVDHDNILVDSTSNDVDHVAVNANHVIISGMSY